VAGEVGEFMAAEWRDTSGRDHRGVLTAHDLAGWQARVETPISVDVAARYQLLKTGPWGQGPVLAQQLRLLEASGIAELPVRSERWVHTIVEAAKLALADREAYYGDPADQVVPIETLLSRAYAVERARLIGESADRDLRPGRPDGREPRLAKIASTSAVESEVEFDRAAAGSVGEPTAGQNGESRGDTCHVDVVDRWGNFVSATERGLAAELTGYRVARIPAGDSRTDVLPRGRAAQYVATSDTTTHHAVSVPGTARWRALAGVRHSRRGPTRPVADDVLPGRAGRGRERQAQSAGGDRCSHPPHDGLSVVGLPACGISGGTCCRVAG
jgi:hypothetical protein